MDVVKRISRVLELAEQIPFDDSSKFVLMSDCHRGDGTWADNFGKNQNLYFTALTHYYNKKYTYIELGDGDELWENNKISDVMDQHSDIFWFLAKFYKERRLYLMYGNHDMIKRNDSFVKNYFYQYYDEHEKKNLPLFPNVKFHEGLVLKHKVTGDKILLIHGHQVDRFCYDTWSLAKFLNDHLWKPLQLYGVNDPTRAAKNYVKKDKVEKRLAEWVTGKKQILIAGHTHRPVFPEVGEVAYFNDGSCVHPRCITALEIEYGYIKLVKWSIKSREDGTLFIDRDILSGPRRLSDYFKKMKEQ